MKTNVVLLLLVLGTDHTPLMAQSAGPFTAAGNMTNPRYGHTATLLPNGKVLITGGRVDNDPSVEGVASAELYDPLVASFTSTGSMNRARAGHTATLLANGKVLVTGGSDASAELYDPASGTFTFTGSMISPHNLHSATLLRDGKVLIAGGGDDAELYDPSTGAFTATGSMHHPWLDAASGPLLPDGTVLIGTEVYHPFTGTFTDTGHVSYDYEYTSTLLIDGRAFIAGGGDSDPGACYSTTELYDPVAASFVAAQKMTLCRFSHTATLLPSGTVLVAGGASYDPGYQANLASVEIYDFSSGAFGWIGNMIAGRQGHTATLLPDGRVLIAGGVGAPGYSALSSAEIYSPAVAVAPPVLLSISGDGQGAIQHADTYQAVSANNPAVAGEVLMLYCTGLADGSAIPPQVAIGGRLAEVLFFGNTPGYTGLNQVNLRVPSSGVAPGSAVPVRLTYLARPSNQVTLSVR